MCWVKKAASMAVLWLSVATLLATSCFGAEHQASEQGEAVENHFVIMYDMSRSMKNADDRLKGMVADFMDQVPARLRPYQIAVIPFAGQCPQTDVLENTENGENSWWEIQTGNGETKEKIINALSKLTYDWPNTDIEGALRICAKTLAAMREDGEACNQTVLFITDGLIDIPGSSGGGSRSRIDNIIASGREVPGIAEDFPKDCRFWAIMPDEETKNSFMTIDADGSILTYNGTQVEKDQQEGFRDMLTCMEDFCSRLNELGWEGMGTRAGTIPMNWTEDTFPNFKAAYTKFFESIWGTITVTRSQVELDNGFEFYVPEGTTEANVTVTPEIEDTDECRLAAERLAKAGGLSVTWKGKKYPAECNLSLFTVNIKLIDPPGGIYCIQTSINHKCNFTLDFLTHSGLKIVTSEQSITQALGSTVKLNGSIMDTTGKQISEDTARSLTLEACVSGEPGGDGNCIPIKLDGSSFQYSFTADCVGDSFLTLYAAYDDTDNLEGVSKFRCRETIAITVPEVSYKGEADRCLLGGIILDLRPYSNLPDGQAAVPAAAAKKYLNDDWVVQLLDGQGAQTSPDISMELSEDGVCFVLECKSMVAETAVMVNRTTKETIEVSIPGPQLLTTILGVAATVLIVVTVVVVCIILFLRKITVSIRWHGDTEVLYLKRDGSPQTGVIGGEPVTAWVEKESGQVAAQLEGRTRRADIKGHSCDIDF